MIHNDSQNHDRPSLSRRGTIGAPTIGAAALAAGARAATPDMGPAAPPSTVTTPPRDFSPNGAPTTYFMDPDIITVDPSFDALLAPTNGLKRLWTGGIWLEGPAWSAQGRYLVFSDIPNNRQLRWLEDDGRVGVFRTPSNHSNGNTFDFQGRQISCEHLARRVVRYEHDGTANVIADNFEESGSIRPMTWCHIRMAASGSLIRPMAANSTSETRCLRWGEQSRWALQSADRAAGWIPRVQTRTSYKLLSGGSERQDRDGGDRGPGP